MNAPTKYLVIFGAAVRPDGEPSGTLRRRVNAALNGAAELGGPVVFVPTGGLGAHPPPEADVMARLLRAAGVSPASIIAEDQANDTLSSVLKCHSILKAKTQPLVVFVCTSPYHAPRCALLFRLLRYNVRVLSSVGDKQALGEIKWWRYVLKEVVATPYDMLILLIKMGLGSNGI
jgi:uncharacterized SAM-binding protein YcdF (DUF218 family)